LPESVALESFNHMNQIVPSYDEAVRHYLNVFGAQFLWKVTANRWAEACLMNFGGAVFEYVAPRLPPPEKPEGGADPQSYWWSVAPGMFVSDFPTLGGHFAGLELKVPDIDEAFAAVSERGFDLLDQRQWRFFMTKPSECHGVSLELYDRDWYSVPSPSRFVEEMKRASYWENEHPLAITGFHFTIAVENLGKAAEFFVDLCGASVAYEEDRPNGRARSIGLGLAGMTVELLTPADAGPVKEFMDRNGERIRSMVFAVKDPGVVARYFATKGVPLIPGDQSDSLAVSPDHNFGVLYEFVPCS
jgi:hypothetical protein